MTLTLTLSQELKFDHSAQLENGLKLPKRKNQNEV